MSLALYPVLAERRLAEGTAPGPTPSGWWRPRPRATPSPADLDVDQPVDGPGPALAGRPGPPGPRRGLAGRGRPGRPSSRLSVGRERVDGAGTGTPTESTETVRVGMLGTSLVGRCHVPAGPGRSSDGPGHRHGCVSAAGRSRPEELAAAVVDRRHWYTDAGPHAGRGRARRGRSWPPPTTAHHPLTMAALRGRAPRAVREAPGPVDTTQAEPKWWPWPSDRGAITMVPFTYRYMPMLQWLRRLLEPTATSGNPHQISCRYFTAYGMDGDLRLALRQGVRRQRASSATSAPTWSTWPGGSWTTREHLGVGRRGRSSSSASPRPDGSDYQQAGGHGGHDPRATGGAPSGCIQASAACWEGTRSSSASSTSSTSTVTPAPCTGHCDWGAVQEVRGSRIGEPGPWRCCPSPTTCGADVRRSPVSDTYRDVFRTTPAMTRAWIDAVADGRPIQPDLGEGLAVQRVLDAAVASSAAAGAPIRLDQPSS